MSSALDRAESPTIASADARLAKAIEACGGSAVFIVGDLSGIQQFIHAVARLDSDEPGIARRLRARSLQLAALSESVCKYLEDGGMPKDCRLSSSGGGFMILAPANDFGEDRIEDLRRDIDEWFWANTWGELALHIGVSDRFKPSDEAALADALGQAREDVAASKLCPFSRSVGVEFTVPQIGEYRGGVFPMTPGGECRSCHKLPVQSDNLCAQCLLQKALGQSVVRGNEVAIVPEDSSKLPVFGGSLEIPAGDAEPVGIPCYAPSYKELGVVPPAGLAYSHIADFDAHAFMATGADKIAVLAVDVDNLGMAMSNDRMSFADKLELSQRLDDFFGDLIREHVAPSDNRLPCYLLYSGGDDVVAVGGWSRVIDLALELQRDFAEAFTAPLTISAGIAIDGPHAPIDDTATLAHHHLERAKAAGQPRGDRISFGGVTAKWGVIRDLRDFAIDLVEHDHVSRSFVHSLYRVMDLYDSYWLHGVPEGLRYKALLVAAMERNGIPKCVEQRLRELLCAKSEFTQAFRFCLDWVSLAEREGS